MRVTVVFGGLACAVSVTLALGTYLTARHYLVGQREQTAARQAFADASFVREGLLTSGAAVDQVLAATSPPAGAVLLLHRNGQWYSSSLSTGREAVPGALRDVVATGAAGTSWGRLAGDAVIAVGTPLTAVEAEFFEIAPATELSSTLRTLGLALAGFALLTTVAGLLIGRAAAGRVIAPLGGIASATARIAGGEIGHRLPATHDPDLSVIVGSFNAMVEALQERLDRDARFATDVSHELRSPVTAMSTAVEVLERSVDNPGRSLEALRLLRREVLRLQHALEQLLALGRSEAGVDELDHRPLELGELLAATLTHTHRPLELLERGPDPAWVVGDKFALRRTVANLLDNADDHAGGVTRVVVERRGDVAVLMVDDHGPGVPLADRRRIFERFARLGSRASRPGTGLGLSLVAETVRAHGGDAWCTDAPNGGARFVVQLPIADTDAGSAPEEA